MPQFLPSAQGAIPLARHTHGAADPKAPSPKGPAAAGQSSRQGQRAERSFFSAGSATRHGHSAVFIGSPSQTSSSGSFFMPWVKKCQELAPASWAMQHEGCCPQPLAPQLPGLDGEWWPWRGPWLTHVPTPEAAIWGEYYCRGSEGTRWAAESSKASILNALQTWPSPALSHKTHPKPPNN